MTNDGVVHGSGVVARQPIGKNTMIADPAPVFFADAAPDATEDGYMSVCACMYLHLTI